MNFKLTRYSTTDGRKQILLNWRKEYPIGLVTLPVIQAASGLAKGVGHAEVR